MTASGRSIFVLAILVGLASAASASDQPVRITLEPQGLVYGDLKVPVSVDDLVDRVELRINGVPFAEQQGRSMVFTVPLGHYLRRLRIRATGYGPGGQLLGEDEIVVNDPQPPFRVRLTTPHDLPAEGMARMSAQVTSPPGTRIEGVDFFLDETLIGSDGEAPWEISFDPALFPGSHYARATARERGGDEANDVRFFGSDPSDLFEVVLHQIPLSVKGDLKQPLTSEDIELIDNGEPREIESLVPATDKPLSVLVLIDSSESMLEELPLIREAAKDFARSIVGPKDRIAIVGFHQRLFWLTNFTNDVSRVDDAVKRLDARGQTHLYDAVIRMLYELQKQPGRKALVVFTDGVNQGGEFELDHVVHYARYSGVPVYPIIRNATLSRLMRFGLRFFEANRFAQIAKESGATWFIIRRTEELPGAYAEIAKELKQQYLILFHTEASPEDHWHTLGVETKRRGLDLRVPRGYFP